MTRLANLVVYFANLAVCLAHLMVRLAYLMACLADLVVCLANSVPQIKSFFSCTCLMSDHNDRNVAEVSTDFYIAINLDSQDKFARQIS